MVLKGITKLSKLEKNIRALNVNRLINNHIKISETRRSHLIKIFFGDRNKTRQPLHI